MSCVRGIDAAEFGHLSNTNIIESHLYGTEKIMRYARHMNCLGDHQNNCSSCRGIIISNSSTDNACSSCLLLVIPSDIHGLIKIMNDCPAQIGIPARFLRTNLEGPDWP
jgi:hypothetical protein